MAWNHTQTTTERGYGAAWRRVGEAVLERDKGLCQPCKAKGKYTPATEVDHITPKSQDGTDDQDNLQAICTPCHKDKTQRENGNTPKVAIGADGWPVQ